jgi:hypothetical protein
MYSVFGEKGISFSSGTLTLQTIAPPQESPSRSAPVVPLPAGRLDELAAGVNRPAPAQTQSA